MGGDWRAAAFSSCDNVADDCCEAWNALVNQCWYIMVFGFRQWARGSQSTQSAISSTGAISAQVQPRIGMIR